MAKSSDDFTDVISREVVCSVCLGELKEPKMLECSHNFCRICLEGISRMSSFRNRLEDIICPECRHPTRIPKGPNGGVSGLPTNRALVNVVEATLANKAKVKIRKNLETGKPRVERLAKRISDFDAPLRVLSEIHEKANELVQTIRDQEACLCREVGEFYHINCETINKEKTDFHKLHSIASKSVQEAEMILQQTMPEPAKAMHAAKALKEQIEKIDELQMNQDTSVRGNLEFKFNSNANKICKNFGTLTTKKVPIDNISDADLSTSDQGVAPVNRSAKVKHISSSVPIDNISDADLYGHSDASSASGQKETNIPMDTKEAQPRSEVLYDVTLYEDMTYDRDTYEDMYSPYTGDSSCTSLPPPPGIPPPTYDQVAQIPGNDWVYLSDNISVMNIDENGHSQVMGVRGVHETADIRELKGRVESTTSSYSNYSYHPLTKREHHFENIIEQSSNTNQTTEGSSWSCERCTFLNSPSHRVCAVCGASRGVN